MAGDEFGNQSIQAESRGGGGILVVDLYPRAPPLRGRLLQRQHRAWEVVSLVENGPLVPVPEGL
jgi:hypothetical protein